MKIKKALKHFFILILAIIISGCGTTDIYVPHSDVDIYINNVQKGKGTAEITRTGVPKKKHITAKYEGQLVGEKTIKRKFNLLTGIVGLYTYGIGLIFCWQYPNTVYVPVDTEIIYGVNNNRNIWMEPPNKWDK